MHAFTNTPWFKSLIIVVSRAVPSNDEVAPIVPTTKSEEPWSPHNYTNVDFAQASAHGQSTGKPKNVKPRRSRV